MRREPGTMDAVADRPTSAPRARVRPRRVARSGIPHRPPARLSPDAPRPPRARGRRGRRGPLRVEHEETPGFGVGEGEETGAHARVEVLLLRLQSVEGFVVGVETAARSGGVEVEEHGQVGEQSVGRPQRQRANVVGVEDPAGALVGDGRVEVAVLDDDVATCHGRTHVRGDVMRAIGGVEQCLGAGVDVAAVMQDDVTNTHTDVGSTRLAGAHDPPTPLLEPRSRSDACVVFPAPSPPSKVMNSPGPRPPRPGGRAAAG